MINERPTILLADDTPSQLQTIHDFLEEDGCELVVALNGLEALERAERVGPDLILLDVMMPGLNGFEVCRQLKSNPGTADIPVIFMTALNTQRDKLEGFTAGAVDYLTKPLQLDEVRARVKVHLKLRSLQRQLSVQNDELRRRSEEFRALVENSPDTVARYDLDCRCLYANPSLLASLGLAVAPSLGKMPNETFPGLPAASSYEASLRAVLASGEESHFTLGSDRPSGESTWIDFRLVPERDRDGKVCSVLAIGRDISIHKQSMDALRANDSRLRQSHDLLRALAGQIDAERETERREIARKIHEDLAQNLAALTLYVGALDPDQGQAMAVSGMAHATERAIRLSREMVTMLRPSVLDFGIAASLHWLAKDFGKGLGLRFDTDIDEDIRLDDKNATFLFRAAQELLVNIALHAAATNVLLSFSSNGNHCQLLIGDNGCGFDPSAPRKDKAFGHTRLAVQTNHHSGSLVIDTAPGRGTRVEITLPLPANARQPSAASAS